MQYITSDIILLHWMLISIDMNCIQGVIDSLTGFDRF